MEQSAIRRKIKQIIAEVANLVEAEIPDDAHLVDDLDLDSLSLLEIGVDIDYAFQLGLPDERLSEIATLDQAVDLVRRTLSGSGAESEIA